MSFFPPASQRDRMPQHFLSQFYSGRKMAVTNKYLCTWVIKHMIFYFQFGYFYLCYEGFSDQLQQKQRKGQGHLITFVFHIFNCISNYCHKS